MRGTAMVLRILLYVSLHGPLPLGRPGGGHLGETGWALVVPDALVSNVVFFKLTSLHAFLLQSGFVAQGNARLGHDSFSCYNCHLARRFDIHILFHNLFCFNDDYLITTFLPFTMYSPRVG